MKSATITTLTERQWNVVELLATGQSTRTVAKIARVERRTLARWARQDDFRDALDARRREIWGEGGDRLRAAVPKAISALEGCLDSTEERSRIAAADALLKAAGPVPESTLNTEGHVMTPTKSTLIMEYNQTGESGRKQFPIFDMRTGEIQGYQPFDGSIGDGSEDAHRNWAAELTVLLSNPATRTMASGCDMDGVKLVNGQRPDGQPCLSDKAQSEWDAAKKKAGVLA